MKKLKNKKRNLKRLKEHTCNFEYSAEHSRPEQTIYICTKYPKCGEFVVEHEDAGTGA